MQNTILQHTLNPLTKRPCCGITTIKATMEPVAGRGGAKREGVCGCEPLCVNPLVKTTPEPHAKSVAVFLR